MTRALVLCIIGSLFLQIPTALALEEEHSTVELGLSKEDFKENEIPAGWRLRKRLFLPSATGAKWVMDGDVPAVKLHSKASLIFLDKKVNIDIREYPIVSWKWKVENVLEGIDERTMEGDDHPIRIFFVFDPDPERQSRWFRFKRFLYLDRAHGHPMGGQFTEYLWSSHLQPGDIFGDPGKPHQKLMVVEGGSENLGKWLSYERNLYEDFKALYAEEPRRLIFIGILNDTDQTGQEAVSYIAELKFRQGISIRK
jgi:hypothetical protein